MIVAPRCLMADLPVASLCFTTLLYRSDVLIARGVLIGAVVYQLSTVFPVVKLVSVGLRDCVWSRFGSGSLRFCCAWFSFTQCEHKHCPDALSCRSCRTPVISEPIAAQLTELTTARRLAAP